MNRRFPERIESGTVWKNRFLTGAARKRIAALITVAMTAPAFAQTGGTFDLSWNTVNGGGGTSSGGTFVVSRDPIAPGRRQSWGPVANSPSSPRRRRTSQ